MFRMMNAARCREVGVQGLGIASAANQAALAFAREAPARALLVKQGAASGAGAPSQSIPTCGAPSSCNRPAARPCAPWSPTQPGAWTWHISRKASDRWQGLVETLHPPSAGLVHGLGLPRHQWALQTRRIRLRASTPPNEYLRDAKIASIYGH